MKLNLKRLFASVFIVAVIAAVPLPAFAATSNGVRGDRVIQTALNYLGRPYVFGSNGPRTFDCSSFVRYVMYKATGIRMPRTAAAQSRVGRQISRAALQKGDIVFFKNTYKYGVSHVGIAGGNGYMIHAWPKGGVKIDSLNQRYFIAKYHSSRTVLR